MRNIRMRIKDAQPINMPVKDTKSIPKEVAMNMPTKDGIG